MHRIGLVFFCCVVFGCGDDKKPLPEEEKKFNYENFSKQFLTSFLPYQLTDIGLSKTKDTASIRAQGFGQFIPDSVKNRIFPKGSKLKFFPIVKVSVPKAETYYLVKTVAGSKRAAFLVTFDEEGSYVATFPFLIPDTDESTTQNTTMDKSYTISRNIIRRKNNEVTAEGKDVYVFNKEARQFTLIMTDLLDEQNAELINPIDTFAKTRKFAGDYVKGKRNLVSIRNGRTPNQALAFIHLEDETGECSGELKGEILFTSSSSAIYRQGGDPCVLQFTFAGSSVTLKEEQGCGNHRGLDCPMEGTYTKKKEPKLKTSGKKSKKK
jgi:hypothetical protein